MRFADIAVNLMDQNFLGTYNNRPKHPPDLEAVLSRAGAAGVERILITGTSLEESRNALELAKRYELWCTAGVHPTSTNEIDAHPSGSEAYLSELKKLIEDDREEGGSKRIISIGEIGLGESSSFLPRLVADDETDFDRLHFSPSETQLKHLPTLLQFSKTFNLPLFLHSRTSDAHRDLVKVLRDVGWDGEGWAGGVVHSFTGTTDEMKELVEMGLYIGINGCSLKTEANLEVVKAVPLDKLLLETDAPWCSPTTTHASSSHMPPPGSPLLLSKVAKPEKWKEGMGVKGRMEPAEVRVIAHIVASIKGIPIEELAEHAWESSMRLFWPNEVPSLQGS